MQCLVVGANSAARIACCSPLHLVCVSIWGVVWCCTPVHCVPSGYNHGYISVVCFPHAFVLLLTNTLVAPPCAPPAGMHQPLAIFNVCHHTSLLLQGDLAWHLVKGGYRSQRVQGGGGRRTTWEIETTHECGRMPNVLLPSFACVVVAAQPGMLHHRHIPRVLLASQHSCRAALHLQPSLSMCTP